MIYHIVIADYTRITIDDENEETAGRCVSLRDGEIFARGDVEDYEDEE